MVKGCSGLISDQQPNPSARTRIFTARPATMGAGARAAPSAGESSALGAPLWPATYARLRQSPFCFVVSQPPPVDRKEEREKEP